MRNECDAGPNSTNPNNFWKLLFGLDRIVARKSIIGISGFWLGLPSYFLFQTIWIGHAKALTNSFWVFDIFIFLGLIFAAATFILRHFFGEKNATGDSSFASNKEWVKVALIASLDVMLFSFSWCIGFTTDLVFL